MAYVLKVLRSAEKELDALRPAVKARVTRRLLLLETDPRPRGVRKLAGGRTEHRLRIGDYRVLYEIDDDERIVTIVAVAHRREAYR